LPTEDIYGIPAERVIGSWNALVYTDDNDGRAVSYEATGCRDLAPDGRGAELDRGQQKNDRATVFAG
jgi:hypothetical protein